MKRGVGIKRGVGLNRGNHVIATTIALTWASVVGLTIVGTPPGSRPAARSQTTGSDAGYDEAYCSSQG